MRRRGHDAPKAREAETGALQPPWRKRLATGQVADQRPAVNQIRTARRILTLIVFIVAAAPAFAEENPAAWTKGQTIADWTSTGLVASQMAAAAITAYRSPDRGHALGCFALRNGVSVGGAETMKRVIHRQRPNGSDNLSFPSEHTWLAGVNAGWRFEIGIPVEIGAGYLRMAADLHHGSDVVFGALFGELTRRLCHE